jgi:hypothetical protein
LLPLLLLTWIDQVELRQAVEKQLNKGGERESVRHATTTACSGVGNLPPPT